MRLGCWDETHLGSSAEFVGDLKPRSPSSAQVDRRRAARLDGSSRRHATRHDIRRVCVEYSTPQRRPGRGGGAEPEGRPGWPPLRRGRTRWSDRITVRHLASFPDSTLAESSRPRTVQRGRPPGAMWVQRVAPQARA